MKKNKRKKEKNLPFRESENSISSGDKMNDENENKSKNKNKIKIEGGKVKVGKSTEAKKLIVKSTPAMFYTVVQESVLLPSPPLLF